MAGVWVSDIYTYPDRAKNIWDMIIKRKNFEIAETSGEGGMLQWLPDTEDLPDRHSAAKNEKW